MSAIYRREFRAYFTSPIGYIYLAVFYCLAGYFFFGSTLLNNTNSLSGVFSSLFNIVVFVIPLLTMRLFSEDKRHKTDQALLTAPVSLFSLIMGKYLAALTVYLLGISITLVFALVVGYYATPVWTVVLGHFLGLFLLGAALIAIGGLISSTTENQVIAAVGGIGAGLFLVLIDSLSSLVSTEIISTALVGISFYNHYLSFTLGVLDLSDVVFFLVVAVLFLFLTARVFEKRRWS